MANPSTTDVPHGWHRCSKLQLQRILDCVPHRTNRGRNPRIYFLRNGERIAIEQGNEIWVDPIYLPDDD